MTLRDVLGLGGSGALLLDLLTTGGDLLIGALWGLIESMIANPELVVGALGALRTLSSRFGIDVLPSALINNLLAGALVALVVIYAGRLIKRSQS